MNRSLKRFSLFAAAVATGALGFGIFWSAQVQAAGAGDGPWCPPNTMTSHTTSVTMCYKGTQTVTGVSPTTQTVYLTSGNGSYCGACKASGS